jgi:metal-responsive CopG/Arc/MetJ family transcriptional regulator
MTGSIVVVIDTRASDVYEKLASVCRKSSDVFMHSTQMEIGNFKSMHTITADGSLKDLKRFISDITAVKGVLRGRLTMVSPSTGNIHHIGMYN